jgi:hypothetical protein
MQSIDLATDSRWRRLHGSPWLCRSCGNHHSGIFDLACGKPDFCVLNGEHYFVRSVLELPIIGSDKSRFGYGVWATLSKTNFYIYLAAFDDGDMTGLCPWFGWFSNSLQGYPETNPLKCQVYPQNDRQRPLIELEPTSHPLAIEQRGGITFDRLLEIYAFNRHDIRPYLVD